MADVLIVCVREDEPQAKALADMFEAAGFSIGGAPSNDAALRSSGAGVVVWSQASIRSRPFLDAAQRVINAGKAVVASLIEPPPASSIGDSAAFDLSRWDGDPNDPSLDSLFFAVDRMVNAARAAVGASPTQPAAAAPAPAYDPPPPPQRAAPKPARAAPMREPSARTPPPQPAANPALETEAEHWRAIRDSNDPADFMDYLSRYGSDGAFSEVAEIRLKRLSGAPQRAAPRQPPPMPRASPQPEPRRYEPPPAPRRVEVASQRPPIRERNYERSEVREPPRGEGGVLRAIVLIGLLGGAAAAAYFYFSSNLPTQPAQKEAEVDAAPPLGEPVDAANEADGGVSLEEAAAPQDALRREPARRAPAPQQRPPQRAPEQEEQSTPAPVTSWARDAAGSGPVSLVPGSQAPSAANPPSANVTAPPAGPDIDVAASPTPASAVPAPPPARVIWTQTFSQRRMAELYPESAARNGVGGRVVLDCVVQPALDVACSVVSSTPATAGFDRAALRLVSSNRARATRSDGTSAVGAHTRVAVNFQPPSR